MLFPLPDLPAARENKIYRRARLLANRQGQAQEFRWFCTLLEAPSDLRWLELVASNLNHAISEASVVWGVGEETDGLQSAVDWILKNSQQLDGMKFDLNGNPLVKEDGVPMKGYWDSYPLYSMMCQTQQDGSARAVYRLLQLQILVARKREIEAHHGKDLHTYISGYENCEFSNGSQRVSDKIRFPDAASHVRLLAAQEALALIAYMNPLAPPDQFGEDLKARIAAREVHPIPIGHQFAVRVKSIANYCAATTRARKFEHRTRREGTSVRARFSNGDVDYSPMLVGRLLSSIDPDDEEQFPVVSEGLLVRHSSPGSAEDYDEHPNESATTLIVGLDATTARTGVKPEQRARTWASLQRNAIDRGSLPWASELLRPEEIAPTLVANLREISHGTRFPDKAALQHLEIAALVTVCLESGRALRDVLDLPFGQDPKEAFSLIWRPGSSHELQWCWKAIEHELKTPHQMIEGKEVSRAKFVTHAMSPTSERLLDLHIRLSRPERNLLFTASEPSYALRIRKWLGELEPNGRLTIDKISKLQWSLLRQLTGNDHVKVSMTLGRLHEHADVPLYYALMPVVGAQELFVESLKILWGDEGDHAGREG